MIYMVLDYYFVPMFYTGCRIKYEYKVLTACISLDFINATFLYIIAEFLLQMNSYKLLITAAVW